MIAIFSLITFVVGYFFITLEHKFKTNKSAVALTLAGLLWIIASFSGISPEDFNHHLVEHGNSVFGLIVFLLGAMTLVEVMIHLNFFDYIQEKLVKFGLNYKNQFLLLSFLTFFLSAILDNLTVTIIMIQIARIFYKDKSLLAVAAGIVIAANSGGAWSPIGDITTLMLWLGGKFTSTQVIFQAFIPSFVLNLVSTYLLAGKIDKDDYTNVSLSKTKLPFRNKLIIGMTLFSFTLPIIMNTIGLPPYFGLMLGLGIVWLMYETIRYEEESEHTVDIKIEHLLQKVDIPSLKFFIGILLAVGALEAMGLLEQLSHMIFGENPQFFSILIGNTLIGLLSAIVDNVPLTALSMDVISTNDPSMWVLTALAVGTGGSCLVIGSAAGVVASGIIKQLNFERYLKIATIPAFVGYIAAIATWCVQYLFIG